MEDFLKKIKSRINGEILDLSNTQDYLADKIKYLEDLKTLEDLKDPKDLINEIKHILTKITYIKYGYNHAIFLEWLKYFPNVTKLNCSVNNLTSTSLESLKYVLNLKILGIVNNNIDDLSNLKFTPNLRELYCSNNKITALPDISTIMPKLKILSCLGNRLIFIDVSNCILLRYLYCSFNNIRDIILQNTPRLLEIICNNNRLITLDINKCKMLTDLHCENNELIELNLQNLRRLQNVYCSFNKLNTLNIKECAALELLYCSDNQLTKLDLSNCLQLVVLNCKNNKIQNAKKFLEICKRLKYLDYDKSLPFANYFDEDKCYICLDALDILDDSKTKVITNCKHIFHRYCLTTWINRSTLALTSTCPYCRQLI